MFCVCVCLCVCACVCVRAHVSAHERQAQIGRRRGVPIFSVVMLSSFYCACVKIRHRRKKWKTKRAERGVRKEDRGQDQNTDGREPKEEQEG